MTHSNRPTPSLRRRSLLALAAALPALVATGAVQAQAWPDKTITLVVPFPPGGPTDTAARIIGEKLGEGLKQQVIIDNRRGASGTIGAAAVAKAPADGYTIMMLATPTLLAPHMYVGQGLRPVQGLRAGRDRVRLADRDGGQPGRACPT